MRIVQGQVLEILIVAHGPMLTDHLMVGLATVERSPDVAPQHRAIDVVEQVERADDVVALPQRPLRAVLAAVRARFPDDHALGRNFQRQREQDALDIWPFRDDQPLSDAASWLDRPVLVVVRRMAKPAQSGLDLAADLAVAWCEAITEPLFDLVILCNSAPSRIVEAP